MLNSPDAPPAASAKRERGGEGEQGELPAQPDEPLPPPHRLSEPAMSPELLRELGEEPLVGLSLDQAIERLLIANVELAARFQDIPKARADVLTAGLRTDPVLFFSASPIAYNRFSPQRPGSTVYDVTVVQSLDVSGKHRNNKRVTQKQLPILEARYQDVARRTIDRLYLAYVNVLEAQAMRAAAQANLQRLTKAAKTSKEQVGQGRRPATDGTRASLRRAAADLAVQRAEATVLHTRRNLSVLLALPSGEADQLRVCGSLFLPSPPPPGIEELIEIARRARPDLRAVQLSVDLARATVRREQAEELEDFFLFFTPYQATDSTPEGKQVAHAWEIGVLIPIPSFNRNQGEIARARVNVTQWRIEVDRAEQEILDEVRRAASEDTVSRQIVAQYERDVLPAARRLRDDAYRRFAEEGQDVGSYLSSQRDYDDALQTYLEALARRRRAALRLNTAVGQRILP